MDCLLKCGKSRAAGIQKEAMPVKKQYNSVTVIYRTFCLVIQTVGFSGLLAPVYYLVEGVTPGIMTMLSAGLFDSASLYMKGVGGSIDCGFISHG